MKRIFFPLIGIFAIIAVLCTGCANPAAKKALDDIKAGHAEYIACLKHCDELAAQYRTQYADCKTHCPTIHPALCDHLATMDQRTKCIMENSHPDPVCLTRCEDEFSKHLDEVNACRQACLAKYEDYFTKVQ